jgi:integrase
MARESKQKHLYLREGSPSWWYRFTDPHTGKQVRRSTGTSEKKLAQAIFDKAKADAWEVKADPKASKRGKVWLEASIRWLEERADKKRTILIDAMRLKILGEVMNHVKLADITNEFVAESVVKGILKPRGIKPATINRYLALIGAILNASYKRWQWLDTPVFLDKPGNDVEKPRKAWITPAQFKLMYGAMPEYYKDMMSVAISTGMRHKNISLLKWSQVDLNNRCIHIPKESFKGKRDHYVPLNETAIIAIRKYVGKHKEMVFVVDGVHYKRTHLVEWHRINDELGINKQLRGVGLLDADEKFVFHGLRHTFATWLARTGTPVEMIERIGGWSLGSGRIVGNYMHVEDVTHLIPYAKRIDEILGKNTGKKFSTILAHNNWNKLAQSPQVND